MNTIIEFDIEAVRAVISALDLFLRVSMGQWREIVDVSSSFLSSKIYPEEFGDALMELRSQWASVEALRLPNAFLKICNTHRSARVAFDVWQRLNEAPDYTASPTTGAYIKVQSVPVENGIRS